jgi:hypothetical protein
MRRGLKKFHPRRDAQLPGGKVEAPAFDGSGKLDFAKAENLTAHP